MSFSLVPRSRFTVAAAIIASVGLLLTLAAGARGATVVNGDFEAGNLTGWIPVDEKLEEVQGSWYAYSGTNSPLNSISIMAPPQGTFAATTDQQGPGTHILYQDVALEPRASHALSVLVYYQSNAPLSSPSPDTLSSETPENQQYRIDVMRPTAPIDSVAPADILAPVFGTNPGMPQSLAPTMHTVDLTPFAGQTVRIRLAEVDNEGNFEASADAVSIASVIAPPANAFTFGKLKLDKKKGTGKLEVNVPGPGTLTAVDANAAAAKSASASKKKKKSALVRKANVSVTAPGVAMLNVKPTGAGKKKLKEKGKLAFTVNVTFTPTGGTAATQPFKGKLKQTKKKKR
ncbi:MAG TPA: hypothetical protein VH476_00745 [Solirubrobacterales bacterium]|jgi:hypothetical protein